MTTQTREKFPFPLFIGLGIAGIGAIVIVPKVENLFGRVQARINADDFAPKYLENKALAAKGNAQAREFMEVANRRLKFHHDETVLGKTESRLFLASLRSRGITEADYLK